MVDGESKALDTNLQAWNVKKVTSRSIEIEMAFKEPLNVSEGEDADLLAFEVCFETFVDINGNNLPECVY